MYRNTTFTVTAVRTSLSCIIEIYSQTFTFIPCLYFPRRLRISLVVGQLCVCVCVCVCVCERERERERAREREIDRQTERDRELKASFQCSQPADS